MEFLQSTDISYAVFACVRVCVCCIGKWKITHFSAIALTQLQQFIIHILLSILTMWRATHRNLLALKAAIIYEAIFAVSRSCHSILLIITYLKTPCIERINKVAKQINNLHGFFACTDNVIFCVFVCVWFFSLVHLRISYRIRVYCKWTVKVHNHFDWHVENPRLDIK